MREGTKENEREGNRMRKVEIERERRTVEGGRCENGVIREGGRERNRTRDIGEERGRENERYIGGERPRERDRERHTGMALRLVTGMPHSSNQKRLN